MYLIRIHIVISWVYLCRRNKNVERSSMKKLFLLRFSVAAFFCLLCVLPALAANIKIKGAVKDKLSKEPLIGATIRLVGTPAGAVTDMDGNFELNSTGVLEGINGKTNCSLFSKHFAQDFVLLTQNKMYILLFPIICFSDFVLSLLLLS